MTINPALALQYQQYNQNANFINKIPDYLPKTYHMHISQKNSVFALLKKQGYDVIPASQADVHHFLDSNNMTDISPLQMVTKSDIEKSPLNDCREQSKTVPSNAKIKIRLTTQTAQRNV